MYMFFYKNVNHIALILLLMQVTQLTVSEIGS